MGWQFRVRIVGLEKKPSLRRGNVSEAGLFFECQKMPAPPGAVERIELSDPSGKMMISTLAVLVRVVESKDLWAGDRTEGLAFEFFPDDDDVRAAIKRFVKFAAQANAQAIESADGKPVGPDAPVPSGFERRVYSVQLQSNWPAERGTQVKLSLDAKEPFVVMGTVQRTTRLADTPAGPRFSVEVQLGHPEAEGEDISRAMDGLLAKLVQPGADDDALFSAETVLSGNLSRVRLPTLFTFLNSEKLTGVVEAEGPFGTGRIYVRQGEPVDAVCDGLAAPRDALREMFAAEDGTFRFVVQDVARASTLSGSGAFLLLDIAREIDESHTLADTEPGLDES